MNEQFKKFTDIELLEQYHNEELEGQDLTDFEERIQTDANLKYEVELFQDMLKTIEHHGEEQLRTKISNARETFEREQSSKPSPKIVRMRRLIAVAASLALLVSVGLYLLKSDDSNRPQQAVILDMYGDKVSSDKTQLLIDEARSYGLVATDKSKRDTLALALENFNLKNYQNTIALLADYTIHYPNEDIAKYYLGLASFELGEYSEALQILQPLATSDTFEEQKTAEWYTVLSHLLSDTEVSKSKAKLLLDNITRTDESPYQKDAKAILEWFK